MRAVQARGLSQAQGAGLQVSSRSHWSHTRIAIATDLGSGLATHMDRKGHGPERPATPNHISSAREAMGQSLRGLRGSPTCSA